MKQTLVLDYIPTDLNTYVNAERTNRFIGAKIKKEETERVYWSCKEQGLKLHTKPVQVSISWHVPTKRKDPDNTSFAIKFVLDGMVKAGVLENDGFKNITSISHAFLLSDTPRVEIVLDEDDII